MDRTQQHVAVRVKRVIGGRQSGIIFNIFHDNLPIDDSFVRGVSRGYGNPGLPIIKINVHKTGSNKEVNVLNVEISHGRRVDS